MQDAVEIEQLISYLIYEEHIEGVILVGHSTGCQVRCNPYVVAFSRMKIQKFVEIFIWDSDEFPIFFPKRPFL